MLLLDNSNFRNFKKESTFHLWMRRALKVLILREKLLDYDWRTGFMNEKLDAHERLTHNSLQL